MSTSPIQVQRTYLLLTLLTTLATSFIWGVNTLFLLDAGLTNTEAFAANAFFSIGMVVFEVPTGVVADTRGRRFSFLLGAATLLFSTLLYLAMWQMEAPFAGWAVASILLGLGFTFFSGATEAWLVDALDATGFRGNLETVFGRGQTVAGAAMLTGSVLGGVVAQLTNLGVPYLLRAGMLGLALVVAFVLMRDLGFTPRNGRDPADRRARGDSGLHRPWPAQSTRALADAGRSVHRRRGHLRLLRHAAVPARAVRRPECLRHRRSGRGHRGWRPDRGRPVGPARAALLQPPHRRRVAGRRAQRGRLGWHRWRGRAIGHPRQGSLRAGHPPARGLGPDLGASAHPSARRSSTGSSPRSSGPRCSRSTRSWVRWGAP